jgi:hypothetical protein
MEQQTPLYMLPVDDPAIAQYQQVYEMMAEQDKHTLRVKVKMEDVEESRCGDVQKMMMALQHHPHLIEKMIFSYVFDFIEDEKTGIVLPEETWKYEPVFYHYFQKLMGTPFVLFFIADEDARYHALMADMVTSGELNAEKDERSGRVGFSFNEEQGQLIVQRVWMSCFNMLQFCYGSGFDPRIYIEGMMALLGVQFTYEELLEEFEEMRTRSLQGGG